MTDEPPATFCYAPEIELAAVSMLLQAPKRCALFFQQLDPSVHLREPRSRIIAQAIKLAWSELGAADWATVVQVVRELGAYEECGGSDGLNHVYSVAANSPGDQGSERIFGHYIEMLKSYARARAKSPAHPVYSLVGGRGTLYPNKVKRHKLDPDYLGQIQLAGKLYSAALWNQDQFLNIKLQPEPS